MTLYLANIWDSLLSERGLQLLSNLFGEVRGNWLNPPRQADHPSEGDLVLLSPSTMESAVTPAAAAKAATTLVGWVLFPDQCIGWDWERQTYRYEAAPTLTEILALAQALAVNSEFTSVNLRRAGVESASDILPLGIDTSGIRQAGSRTDQAQQHGVHVLWSHMWRTQKNPETAFRVALALLERVPNVRVTVGRQESWLDGQHSPVAFRQRVTALAAELRERWPDRVRFLDHFATSVDYWRMLHTVDISYTCSLEESFGVAMLEHAAAGAACVCPNAFCYPETQPGAYLVSPDESILVEAIASLAADPVLLGQVKSRCQKNATQYAIEKTVQGIARLFGVGQPPAGVA